MSPEIVTASAITPTTMPTPTGPAAPAAAPVPAAPSPALDSSKVDGAGVVFDPARHIDRMNAKTGRWMPRGGRKPGSVAAGGSTPAPAAKPAPSFIPDQVPPPPAAEAEAAKPGPAAGEPAPGPDNSEDAAECAARALQFAAGTVFDDHAAATPPPKEHESMVRGFAAFIRSKGWQATAGVAVVIIVAAWLMRVLQKDKPREKVRSWMGLDRAEKARDVTPADKRPTPPPPPPAPTAPRSVHDLINITPE